MASSLVIKVKHGETLRRFNACINVSGKLDLDIERLRKKIVGLFNFVSDTDFSLTYVDEDGDAIMLVDEEDLRDIMKQCLNPLRITVKLNGSIHQKISFENIQHLFPNLNTNASIDDITKFHRESFFEALSTLPLEVASKAISAIPEFVDYLTKTGGFYMNPLLKPQGSTASTAQRHSSKSEASKNDRSTSKEMHGCTFKDVIDPSGGVPIPMIKVSGISNNDRSPSESVVKSWVLDQNVDLQDRNSSAHNSMEGVRRHRERDFTKKYPRVGPPRFNSQFFGYSVSDLGDVVVAPSTPFKKTWKVRNNGLDAWPRGTQLVWAGGVVISKLCIKLEIPINGVPVGNYLIVAASFVAPQLPGSHVSYWSLASPSGQCFGEPVAISIQVMPSWMKCKRSEGFDLNLVPESKESGDKLAGLTLGPMGVEEKIVDANHNEKPRIPMAVSSEAQRTGQTMAQKYNRLMVEKALCTQSPCPSTTKGDNKNSDVEQTLLNELDIMGFKHVGLNREVLRLNNFDLEQSVVDLCCGFALDPKLNELQNLGFTDMAKNKKLLLKHNGSIDDVIWDLIL